MSALYLGKRLSIEVIMEKRQPALLSNKATAILPTRQFRNKVIRRRQFNIDLETFFEERKLSEDFVAIRLQLQVNIDG